MSMHAFAYPLYTTCMGDSVSCMGDSESCMGDPVSMYLRVREGSLPLGAATCSDDQLSRLLILWAFVLMRGRKAVTVIDTNSRR